MKKLLNLLIFVALAQGCITDTGIGDDPASPMDQPMLPTAPDPSDKPTAGDDPVPVEPPTTDPTPVDDPIPMLDPVETPPVEPQAPMGQRTPVTILRMVLNPGATDGQRRIEDGRLFIEASQKIIVQTVLSLPTHVSTEDGWRCQTTLDALDADQLSAEIRIGAQATLVDCRRGTDTPPTTVEHTRQIELPNVAPGAYTVVADGTSDESGPLYFVVVPDGELPMSCAACDQCGQRRDECVATCRGISEAMEFEHAQSWWNCMQERVCEPDQARACLDTLPCQVDRIIAGHCDVLARCANDGRGWLNEDACREEPYYEARIWSCLRPERRSAVTDCMSGQTCGDLEACLRNSACQGDMGCLGAMSTRLAVDCHGICDRSNPGANCNFSQDLTGCYQRCDQAAFRLNDEARREMESCARDQDNVPACQASDARTVVEYCVGQLSCESDMLTDGLAAARARCPEAATGTVASKMPALECLGHVIETNVYACLTEAACEDLEQCVTDASCGDDENCLAFATLRITEE